MTDHPTPSIRVTVDPTNPGQFFACCGLLELADRLWPGAEGWFEKGEFCIACGGTLEELLAKAQQTRLEVDLDRHDESEEGDDQAEEEDIAFVPMKIVSPVNLLLNWWQDKGLKTWAGTMKAPAITLAMSCAIDIACGDPLNQCGVVRDPSKTVVGKNGKERIVVGKPREPFYFDARRGANAVDRDIGFVPDSIKKAYKIYTYAYPAVEFLCLLGLQRCRPLPTNRPRVFEYFTWSNPSGVAVLPAATSGLFADPHSAGYRFRNSFRTGQKKHKTFTTAIPQRKGAHS